MGKRKNHPLIEGLQITAIAAEGKSLGKYNDMVVFVPTTVPGDVVDVQIRTKRKKYMEGFVVNFRELSPLRVEPCCEHFGVCGGCKWQNLPYDKQLEFKHEQVIQQLRRIGKIEIPEIPSPLPSSEIYFYRNKLEYTFSPKRWMTREEIAESGEITDPQALGFHIPGMFDKILDIRKCWLQPDPSNAIRLEIKDFCLREGYEFYDQRTHEGFMRNLIVRTSSTGEVMVIVVFALDRQEEIVKLMSHITMTFPRITSLYYIVNSKLNDSITDQTPVLFEGKDHIVERMERLMFKIGPKSFYQTNSDQAYNLYKITREFAGLTGSETVYDLYTGTGTIANFIAGHCAKVIGIEYVPEAIEDAKENSELNGISNTEFFAGDMKDVLTDGFIAENGRPDVIIVDPPRAGMHEDVVKTILNAAPERIVYVSCNPASQARDLALFDESYIVTAIQPVDMFPHTHHIENVVRLQLREPIRKNCGN